MKSLRFAEGMARSVIEGTKKITLRKYRFDMHSLAANEIFIGSFADGFDFLLQATSATETKPFSELTDEEAQEDGYTDVEDALEDLKEFFYPELQPTDTLAIIRFEVLHLNSVPIIKFND